MKLRQKEFCHNCQQDVIYEFEDITERQIIYCPNCGHQHYRELDEGTIVNIRMERGEGNLRVATDLPLSCDFLNSDVVMDAPIMSKEFKIIGKTEDGRPIIEKTEEEIGTISTEQTKRMSERRWGRDPRQGG